MLDFFRKFQKKEVKKDHYLGLVLKEKEAIALAIEINESTDTVEVIDERNFEYSDSWEKIVEDVDKALYKLEEDNKINVSKVIYFLYSHLVDQKSKDIKSAYKANLKAISKDLDLKLLGFSEIHEGIALYFQKREQSLLTSIIIELDASSLSVFIYKGGEVIFSDAIARTQDLPKDLETIFSRVEGDVILPSRIILYNSSDLLSESDKIVNHKWDERMFIQIPRVEVVSQAQIRRALEYSISHESSKDKTITETSANSDTVMGFVVGQDIAENEKEQEEDLQMDKEIKVSEKETVLKSDEKILIKEQLSTFWDNFKGKLIALRGYSGSRPKIFAVVVLGLLTLVIFIGIVLYFFHHASVTVYFEGKKEEKEFNIAGALNESSDNKLLAVKKTDEALAKEESVSTSGKKTIGEKSKGEATAHNWESVDKIFKKGTIMTSPSGIKFVLDNEIKVASASEVSVGVKQTGKAKASLTAFEIGSEGNIDKNQKLKIEDFSQNQYFASPNESFSGGSKKDIQTVSKDDTQKIKEKIIENMKKDKSKIIKDKIGNDRIIEFLTKVEIVEEKYSKEVGEEAKNLSLKARGKMTLYSFEDKDLKKILLAQFEETLPENYELSAKSIAYRLTDANIKDREIDLEVKASILSIIKSDENKILSDIEGKDSEKIEEIIKEKYKARGFEAKINTPFPYLNSRIPFFKKNIVLKIEPL